LDLKTLGVLNGREAALDRPGWSQMLEEAKTQKRKKKNI
jgi:hypothetical protein